MFLSPTSVLLFGLGIFVIVAAGILVYSLFRVILGANTPSERLFEYMRTSGTVSQEQSKTDNVLISRLRYRLNTMLLLFSSEELELKLVSAHWPITDIEYMTIRYTGTLIGFILGWIVVGSILSAIGLAVFAFLIPPIYLNWSIRRRRKKFSQQLVDVLVLLTGGIRAGYSLLQALDHVIREMPSPSNEEFKRVRQEVRLGIPMSEALRNLSNRMENSDLNLVVMAIIITQKVGGNMTQMMSIVTETIRDRNRLFNEVRSITAQQRFTGQMLSFLPIIVGSILFVISPSYMARIFEPDLMWVPIVAGVGILIGNIIIRRLVVIDY